MAGKSWWTPEMDGRLTELFPKHSSMKVAELMNLKKDQVCYRASVLGLKKTAECKSMSKGLLVLTEDQVAFIRKNYERMSNRELAVSLGFKIQTLRDKLYELGFYRMRLEYWTDEQIDYLKRNYQTIGDLELSEIFQSRWPKQKKWTIKHIEKKRSYLKLKRSPEQLARIKQRNIDNGRCFSKGISRWLSKGFAQDGDIRFRMGRNNRKEAKIKVNGRYRNWARYTWEKLHGPIPAGMNVSFKDGDSENLDPNNLELLTRKELADRNVKKAGINLSDNYIAGQLSYRRPELRDLMRNSPDLIELKRQQLILQRTINNYDNGKSKHSARSGQ